MERNTMDEILGSSVKSFSKKEMEDLFETSDSDVRFTPILRAGKTVGNSTKACGAGGVSAISGLASYANDCLG